MKQRLIRPTEMKELVTVRFIAFEIGCLGLVGKSLRTYWQDQKKISDCATTAFNLK
jgi:hypothetical protein